MPFNRIFLLISLTAIGVTTHVFASEEYASPVEIKGQMTYIGAVKPAFNAAYTESGYNSLSPGKEESHSFSSTIFIGAHLWQGGELYVNGEMVVGVPYSNLSGLAAVPNSELQKVSGSNPLFYIPRGFIRQTWLLSDNLHSVASAINQIATVAADRQLIVTVGKMSVEDIFDGNDFAHDGRKDFMNWVNVAGGAFDYAADVRGYTIGAALEYDNNDWAFRAGRFMVPIRSNGLQLNYSIMNYHGDQIELEHDHQITSHPGKIRLTGFWNREKMGAFRDATDYGLINDTVPDLVNIRKDAIKRGYIINLQQELISSFNLFSRLSWNDGQTEAYAYTEVERSVEIGGSLSGSIWARDKDVLGIAATENAISSSHQYYLEYGGMGALIGDGALQYKPEKVAELFYSANFNHIWATLDWQHINDPAYNAARGPVNSIGFRLHAEL